MHQADNAGELEDSTADGDIDNELRGFDEEWEAAPNAVAADMSRILIAQPEPAMTADNPALPQDKREWSIIRSNVENTHLNHHSDNPFDFLPSAKLDELIRLWMGDKSAGNKLGKVEKEFFGQTRIKKMLAKVVCVGSSSMEDERRLAWIRSAFLSALAQSGDEAKVQRFASLRFAIKTSKPGYSWVVFPVGIGIFEALEGIRGAMDPRSGTLVLFRQWKDESFPVQHFFAVGIHRVDDSIPFELATADFAAQMRTPLATHNLKIIAMTPAYHDKGEYTTKIQFRFDDGALPFLINPRKLTRRFWTGLGNSKTVRSVTYKWPPKCRRCESETHLSPECPWQEIELNNRKPNFHNCLDHGPGWVEPSERPKGMTSASQSKILDMKPKQKTDAARNKTIAKGKGKAVEDLPQAPGMEPMQGGNSEGSLHLEKGETRVTDNVK